MTSVAIIGAGISGLTLAHKLKHLAHVQLFDKAIQPGGRMSSRMMDKHAFDHGTQFFTVKTIEFADFLKPYIEREIVTRWDADFVEFESDQLVAERKWNKEPAHYVGQPDMNAFPRALAKSLSLQLNTEISHIEKIANHWQLTDNQGETYFGYDWVIITLPAPQTAQLLPADCDFKQQVKAIDMKPCFALMLGFNQAPPLPWQAALVRNSLISWMSVNSSKPGRPQPFSMVIQANNSWAADHLNDDAETVKNLILNEVYRISGMTAFQASFVELKRWMYANVPKQKGPLSLSDPYLQLGVCGDWCVQGRVEAAFSSANDLATRLGQSLQN